MFCHRVDDEISLELVDRKHAAPLFAIVDRCRDYLGEWLDFVAKTTAVEHTENFCQSSLEWYAAGTGVSCVMLYRGVLCGTIGLVRIDRFHQVGEIGYWLDEAMQGKGIVTRAARSLTTMAFAELGLHRVEIRVAEGNRPSWSVAERLGYALEGTSRQALRVGEVRHDIREYAMLAPDWRA